VSDWVVLELSPKADNEDPDIVRASIKHLLRDAEIFIPVSVVQQGDDRLVKYLIDGYAFIRKTHPDERYFRLEGTKYIQTIVTVATIGTRSRRLACVKDADIDKFRSQIKSQEDQGIDVGDLVHITSGPYKNLKAFVIEDIPELDSVQIHVQLRSKDSLVTLPRAFMRLQEKAPRSPSYERMVGLRAQVNAVLVLAEWGPLPDIGPVFHKWLRLQRVVEVARHLMILATPFDPHTLKVKGEEYAQTNRWVEGTRTLFSVVAGVTTPLEAEPFRVALAQLTGMTQWVKQINSLAAIVFPLYSPFFSTDVQAKYLEWLWMADLHDRLFPLLTEIERIEQKMTFGGPDNIILDGHNLAVRCASAPGLGELKDSQGRPTGAIVGFLNTLASLKKRFPGASFWVTWDGSSQRRKAMFGGYKAGRGHPRATFETSWLQENLPFFGISQAWNAVEEADDAIATLVKGSLAGQTNYIFSNDRDLLQLVTETTSQLIPAVGAGKEKLFGPAEVEAEYGVVPSMMPQLRALAGDSSDTIPGCQNCGLKTASKLVMLYASVEKLLASNMAGLAKGLTKNLRASEQQIRLNVKLMTLVSDLDLTVIPPDEDEKAAAARLQEVDVKPGRLLASFFGHPVAALHPLGGKMSSGYVIPVDPSSLANRLIAPDPFDSEAEEPEDVTDWLTPENHDKVAALLDRIPQREADLLYLYFIEHKRQADIAAIFDVTQAAVSYRLDRGLKRIKFLIKLPHITDEGMREDLPKVPFNQMDVNILIGMWDTTCQSEVAAQLGLTQGRVRHRFFKAVKVLEDAAAKDDLFQPYSQIFSALSKKKFNILREVKLPQWAGRGGDRVT